MTPVHDLIVLTADNDMLNTIKGILSRSYSMAIPDLTSTLLRHPERDPGCATKGVDFLASFARRYRHGLLIFDHEGSGREATTRRELQQELDTAFARSPWQGRAKRIVIDPELETWVWNDSPHVDSALGWKNKSVRLRDWLSMQDYLKEGCAKPDRPKEALQATLRMTRTPRSASLYLQIAQRVSLSRCTDPAFLELKAVLQDWFRI